LRQHHVRAVQGNVLDGVVAAAGDLDVDVVDGQPFRQRTADFRLGGGDQGGLVHDWARAKSWANSSCAGGNMAAIGVF
jgi:hypothetical protein